MDKEKMLKMLLDDLNSMSDQQLIRDYKSKGINVIGYDPNTKGEVCLYQLNDGILEGNTYFTDSIELIDGSKYNCFEVKGVA